MVHRDPETGEFRSGPAIEDVEYANFQLDLLLEAADVDGTAGPDYPDAVKFEGIQLYDAEELIDRHERAIMLQAAHSLTVYLPSTATADGSIRASVEVSANPSLAVAHDLNVAQTSPVADQQGSLPADALEFELHFDDTRDVLGRPLQSQGGGGFSDGATGVGGSAGNATDSDRFEPVDFDIDDRDEFYANGAVEVSNTADQGAAAVLTGQHVYAILED